MPEPVLVERRGATAVLTLSREHAGNSVGTEVTGSLSAFFEQASGERSLRAVVITGAGDRFFSTGGDVKAYRALESREQLRTVFDRPRRLMDAIELFPVPVLAAVNGWALGGGAELMLACDIRVAARHAQIGFPYSKLSLTAGWHGAERLVRAVGYARAAELLLRGEPVDAERALQIGLVHEVAGDGGALEHALSLARTFESRAPLSLGATKRILRAIARESASHARAVADAEFEDLWMSEDHREAEAAFAAKRPARFKGR